MNKLMVMMTILATLSGVHAGTVYVDVSASGASDGSSWVNAYPTLRAAVDASAAGDEIRIAEGVYFVSTSGSRTDPMTLKKNMKLVGGFPKGGGAAPDAAAYPVVLDGELQNDGVADNNSSVFIYLASGVTIDGLVFRNGYQEADEDAMLRLKDAVNATVANCLFKDNFGHVYCGQTAECKQTVTFRDCVFRDNGGVDGAVFGIRAWKSGFIAEGCEFVGNVATNGPCCMMKNKAGPYGTQKFIGCTFLTNVAEVSGGVACSKSAQQAASFFDCHFTNNCARTGSGGVIYCDGIDWQGGDMNVSNCTFVGNWAQTDGGVACITSNDKGFVFRDSTLEGNSARMGSGGALASTVEKNNRLSCYDCTFRGNSAEAGKGGAISWVRKGFAHLYRTTFEKNQAKGLGGAVYVQYASDVDAKTLIAEDCTFDRNRAGGSAVTWERSQWGSGAISEFTRCRFTGNVATNASGGAYSASGTTGNALMNYFQNCLFAGNSSSSFGGALMLTETASATSCTFAWNTAKQGGAVANNLGQCVFSNVVFHANSSFSGGDDLLEYSPNNWSYGDRARIFDHCSFDADPGEYQVAAVGVKLGCRYEGILKYLKVTVGAGMVYGAPRLVGDSVEAGADDDASAWTERSRLASTSGHWTGSAWQCDSVMSGLVDAGPAAWAVGDEPKPNGGRVNMGFDAGLSTTSKSRRPGLTVVIR